MTARFFKPPESVALDQDNNNYYNQEQLNITTKATVEQHPELSGFINIFELMKVIRSNQTPRYNDIPKDVLKHDSTIQFLLMGKMQDRLDTN